MKVLMMGQEFPSNITGSINTPFYGLIKGLPKLNGVEGSFVVPKVLRGEDKSYIKLIGANDVLAYYRKVNLKKLNQYAVSTWGCSIPFYSVDQYFNDCYRNVPMI